MGIRWACKGHAVGVQSECGGVQSECGGMQSECNMHEIGM